MPDQATFDELAAGYIRIDWKSPGEETLVALRDQLGELYGFLEDSRLWPRPHGQ